MANNRMWLVNPRNGQRILLAKYYPSTGWAAFGAALSDKLDEFFAGDEDRSFSHAGETDWQLEYDDQEMKQ